MVGDSVKDDVVCGNRAGAVTVLLDYQGKAGLTNEQFEGEMKPLHVVSVDDGVCGWPYIYTLKNPPRLLSNR